MSGVEAVLQRDEIGLLGDPVAIGREALLFGGLLVGLHVLHRLLAELLVVFRAESRRAHDRAHDLVVWDAGE